MILQPTLTGSQSSGGALDWITGRGTLVLTGNMTISGNLGLGGTPAEALHIIKTTGNFSTARFDSGTTQGYFFAYDGDNTINFGSNSNADVNFKVNNTTKLSITTGAVLSFAEALNMSFGTTTGTKIGTATSQKISLWNATPNIQPTTSITAATFVANTSLTANDTATWDGYTIGQVVAALRRIGALA